MRTASIIAIILAATLGVHAARAQDSRSPVEAFVENHWDFPLAPQGDPPASFSPLESSLEPQACGTCHPVQFEDWKTTLHAEAMGPGITGQLADMAPSDALDCMACHAPLAEQRPFQVSPSGRVEKNPLYVQGLDEKGLVCAACHVRRQVRFGPPKAGKPLGPSAEKAPHGGVTRTPFIERSEFCRTCHQHDPSTAVNGKPIENTYVEWKEGPYAKMGVQCQDCHMPGRKHVWRGIHDKEMTARAVTLGVRAARGADAVPGRAVAEISLTNAGAGHMFPTYMVPAVFIKAELLDRDGNLVPGSRRVDRIQRQLEFNNGWVELADTRIPPRKTHVFSYNVPNPGGAKRLRVYVEVHPDFFYARNFFPSYLEGQIGEEGRRLITQARDHGLSTPYILYDRTLELP